MKLVNQLKIWIHILLIQIWIGVKDGEKGELLLSGLGIAEDI